MLHFPRFLRQKHVPQPALVRALSSGELTQYRSGDLTRVTARINPGAITELPGAAGCGSLVG